MRLDKDFVGNVPLPQKVWKIRAIELEHALKREREISAMERSRRHRAEAQLEMIFRDTYEIENELRYERQRRSSTESYVRELRIELDGARFEAELIANSKCDKEAKKLSETKELVTAFFDLARKHKERADMLGIQLQASIKERNLQGGWRDEPNSERLGTGTDPSFSDFGSSSNNISCGSLQSSSFKRACSVHGKKRRSYAQVRKELIRYRSKRLDVQRGHSDGCGGPLESLGKMATSLGASIFETVGKLLSIVSFG